MIDILVNNLIGTIIFLGAISFICWLPFQMDDLARLKIENEKLRAELYARLKEND